MDNKEFYRFSIDLPKDHHRRLKTISCIYGKSMREMLVDALELLYKDLNSPKGNQSENAMTIDEMFGKLRI